MATRAALYFAIALCSTTIARAEPINPDFRADGTVRVGSEVFATREAFYKSQTFQDSGGRCGTIEPAIDPLALGPTDCSFSGTVINPLYNDNRVFVIQVVFHVIKNTAGMGDITPQLLQSQIDILNEDFNALAGTPGAMGNNTKLQFVLAKLDPMGNPTTGINYVTNDTYYTETASGGTSAMKTALHWDTMRYFNIYTNQLQNSLLGYATFPQEDAGNAQDGVVLLWTAVGRNAPGGPPYDLGRTATHEVGHYLGLFHTFQGGCGTAATPYTSGDLIGDTNREKTPQYNCTAGTSCAGAGANPIENYMDYTPDACMTKFTAEQTNRVRCALINYRTVNTAPKAMFTYSAVQGAVTFTNASTDAETPAMLKYSWTFGDGMMSTDANPTHTYATAGTYPVKLDVIDPGSGTATSTQMIDVTIAPATPDAGGGGGGGDDDGGGGGGGGCCQAPNGDSTFVICAVPVLLVLRRRRRRS